MNLGRCPCCHTRLHLDQMVQDEAGRDLLGLLSGLDAETGRALVLYLSLFRPARQDLRNDRALRLARSALALGEGQPQGVLAAAMFETVDSIRKKGPPLDPLEDHAYLKRVVRTVAAQSGGSGLQTATVAAVSDRGLKTAPTGAHSKTFGAIAALDDL